MTKDGKKTGGRKAGTPNKATANCKAVFQNIVDNYMNSDKWKTDFGKLDAKDRIDVVIKLAAFIIPKPQSVSLDLTEKTQKTIEDTLIELSAENEK